MRRNATLVALTTLSLAGAASAAVISATGSITDQAVTATGTVAVTDQNMRVGTAVTGSTVSTSDIFVFQLPALGVGETVTSASFTAVVTGGNDFTRLFQKGADLYGLRYSASSAVTAADYFLGAYGTDATEATGIQQNFLYQPNSTNVAMDPAQMGAHSTDATGSTNLGAWIQSLYSGGAVAGNYVFLRLNTHGDITLDNRYWQIGAMNNTTVANRPTLSLTTAVPEPASLALAGGSVAMLMRRRRHA